MDKYRYNKVKNITFVILCRLSLIITLVIVVGIVGYIVMKGTFVNGHPTSGFSLTPSFLFTLTEDGGKTGGILGICFNTFLFVLLTTLVASPIGIASAIYLSYYAPKNKITEFIEASITTLQSLPSIIFGLFGMLVFVDLLHLGFSLLSGVLTISLMVLPTIIATSENAIKGVDRSLFDASVALGSTYSEAIFKVVLKESSRGIVSALLLSVGRAFGETAALLYVIGSSSLPVSSLLSPARTLSMHIYLALNEAQGLDKVYSSALVLLILVLCINTIAHLVLKSINKKIISK